MSLTQRLQDASYTLESKQLEWIDKKKRIETLANTYHSLKLIDLSASPNENTIYILWGDLEITDEKGSWAFGQRNVRTFESPVFHFNVFAFPFFRNEYCGIMLTLDECRLFKQWILEICK